MAILFDAATKLFKLDTTNTSYVMGVAKSGHLNHHYFGAKISDLANLAELWYGDGHAFTPYPSQLDPQYSRGISLCEFPSHAAGDYRSSAAKIIDGNGLCTTDPLYESHRIYAGKPEFTQLPGSFASPNGAAETLEITLSDAFTGVKFELRYTLFSDSDVIVRSVKVINTSKQPVHLNKIMSASFDLPYADYDFLHLDGTWARERHLCRTPIVPGTQSIESRRSSSGHMHNPAFAVTASDATEESGDAYGVMLVYSGSFQAAVERDGFGMTRVQVGINPEDFSWLLESGGSFEAPEALLSFSGAGIGQMSRNFHDFLRNHIVSPKWSQIKRPILINNWEATYFNFDTEKLLTIARSAADLGIEMLVLDDGWFGHREDDTSSLGDWFVNEKKIGSLKTLVEKINALGMKFGLWFEPEMISEDSELFQAHPDWVLTVPGRDPSLWRNQMVLNMARPEVVDYLVETLSKIIGSANIYYIKWDMNRQPAEMSLPGVPPEQQGEIGHRYVLGVYELHRRLLERFPNLLIEGCSGGGGRFDAGLLHYVPQIWTSDNTDAFERIKIQFGTSMFYPASTMGAHVSASPNHQTRRPSHYKTRGDVALFGTFGYELDLSTLKEEERRLTRSQVANYHKFNHLVVAGDLYRLSDSFGDKTFYAAWEFAAKDASEALLVFVLVRNFAEKPVVRVKLRGLDPQAKYRIADSDRVYSGDTLMNAGLPMPRLEFDGASEVFHLVREA